MSTSFRYLNKHAKKSSDSASTGTVFSKQRPFKNISMFQLASQDKDGLFPFTERAFSSYAQEKYGQLAHSIIDLREDYTVPEVQYDADDFSPENDPFGIYRDEVKLRLKLAIEKSHLLEDQRVKFYHTILQNCSLEVEDAIKRLPAWDSQDPNIRIRGSNSPFRLWTAVRAVCSQQSQVGNVQLQLSEAKQAYELLLMSSFDSLVLFKEKYDNARINYEHRRGQPIANPEAAMDFIRKLDKSRFSTYIQSVYSDSNRGIKNPPQTVQEAYLEASNHISVLGVLAPEPMATAYAAKTERSRGGGRSSRPQRRTEEDKDKSADRKQPADTKPTAKPTTQPTSPATPKTSTVICHGCGEAGHKADACPYAKSSGSKRNKQKYQQYFGWSHRQPDSDDDDSDDESLSPVFDFEDLPPLYDYSSDSEDDNKVSERDDDDDDDGDDIPNNDDDDSDDDDDSPSPCLSEAPESVDETSAELSQDSKPSLAFASADSRMDWNLVLLDNQANTSIFRNPHLLTNLHFEHSSVVTTGISGDGLRTISTGCLPGFPGLKVGLNTKGQANILSMYEVEKLFKITYSQGISFQVHTLHGDITFELDSNHLYSADFTKWRDTVARHPLRSQKDSDSDGAEDEQRVFVVSSSSKASAQHDDNDIDDDLAWLHSNSDSNSECSDGPQYSSAAFQTVAELKSQYTAAEIKRADEAMHFIRALGHMTETEAIALVASNNLSNCTVTAADIRRAFKIYGGDVAAIKGKTTRETISSKYESADVDPDKRQVMHSDVMHVRNQRFLISVVSPLELTLVTPIDNEKINTLVTAIKSQLHTLGARGFFIPELKVDPHSSLSGLVSRLDGVHVQTVGAGDHVSKAERKIRTIKERLRSIIASLPYRLPDKCVKDLVMFVVNRINIQPYAGGGNFNLSPRVLFTGKKIDAIKELTLSFGDYAEVRDPKARSNHPDDARTESAIALYPIGNDNGSWRFLCLQNNSYITRSQFKRLPTPDVVINRVNQLADAGVPPAPPPAPRSEAARTIIEASTTESHANPPDAPLSSVQARTSPLSSIQPTQLQSGSASSTTQPRSQPSATAPATPAPRRSERLAAGKNPPSHLQQLYNFHITLKKAVRQFGDAAIDAIKLELRQLLDKGTFTPVKASTLSSAQRKRVIRSSMFLKEKFNASGIFEKLKARLVANGSQQDRELYDNISSPTVSLPALFIMLTLAAKEKRIVTSFDIGNAYLNASMENEQEEVLMVVDRFISNILKHLAPNLAPFANPDTGELTVRLNRALYGCIRSARLWYERLHAALVELGYTANEVDPCVFYKMIDGVSSTILVYVDDILCLCVSPAAAEELHAHLLRLFGEVKRHTGMKHSYLGMSLDFSTPGEAVVDMRAYLASILSEHKIAGAVSTPATSNLFIVDNQSSLLAERERCVFHTCVAKLQGYPMPPLLVLQDNMSTIAIISNDSPQFRSRYIRIRYFFMVELIQSKEIIVEYLPTAEMVADILTKPLQGALFASLRALLLSIK